MIKLVDSLNSKKQVKEVNARNWYKNKLLTKRLANAKIKKVIIILE